LVRLKGRHLLINIYYLSMWSSHVFLTWLTKHMWHLSLETCNSYIHFKNARNNYISKNKCQFNRPFFLFDQFRKKKNFVLYLNQIVIQTLWVGSQTHMSNRVYIIGVFMTRNIEFVPQDFKFYLMGCILSPLRSSVEC
jgi:hypothetical protein